MTGISQIALILTIAILPSVAGLWQMKRSRHRFDRRWDRIRQRSWIRPAIDSTAIDLHNLPLGHSNCRWSAKSSQLRCAINPYGPCLGCRDYTPIDPHW
jgi:hypothetical protein